MIHYAKPFQFALIAAFLSAPLSFADTGHSHAAKDRPWGKIGDPKKATRTVTITATEIAYDVKDLTFETGETVKFVLINNGEQNHELTIADRATQKEHQKMMADMPGMTHEEMEAAMGGHREDDDYSLDVKPGETKALVWQFVHPGSFTFSCNYPGHVELGMEGRIVVK